MPRPPAFVARPGRKRVRMPAAGLAPVFALVLASCTSAPTTVTSSAPELPGSTTNALSAEEAGSVTEGTVGDEPSLFSAPESYAADYEAWGALSSEGAIEAEFFQSLDQMAAESTTVIVGTVIELGPVRTIVGDAEGDVLLLPSLIVRVDRVIRGSLPTGERLGDFLTLEALRVPAADRLPREPALMFIRYKHDPRSPATPSPSDEGKFRLVSSQGLMIPGPGGTTLLPVFEAAYRDLLGDPLWAGGDATSLYANTRDASTDEIVATLEAGSDD